jgi:very-short-patch-repair endonuclease
LFGHSFLANLGVVSAEEPGDRELSGFSSTPRTKDQTVRLLSLAEAQFGVVARCQLEKNGVGSAMIARWLRAGRLHRLHPRVYALGHRRLSNEGELVAALLYAGPGAALSHATAAWWWRLIDHRPLELELSAPGHTASLPSARIHHPRRLHTTLHRGLPITTVPQTLLDFAALAPEDRVRRALAEADYRRLVRLGDVRAVLGRGHPGSANLRRAMAIHQPELARTRSELEQSFLALCARHRIPSPRLNVMVAGLMVDALWPDQRVIVELDGARNHSSSAQIHRDRERDLRLRALGYLILRYSYHQVTRKASQVATDLTAALLSRD